MSLKVLLPIVLLLSISCAKKSSQAPKAQVSLQSDLIAVSDRELLQHVGEKVTLHGNFSLRGKVGPYILLPSGPIYVVSQGSFSWGNNYARMEGRDVRVTGILRYAHDTDANLRPDSEQHAPDYFYFEAETCSITLTMDTYSHVLPDMQQGASDKLERMLFTKTGTK